MGSSKEHCDGLVQRSYADKQETSRLWQTWKCWQFYCGWHWKKQEKGSKRQLLTAERSCSSISSLSSFDLSRVETQGLDIEPTANRPSHFRSRSCSASVNRRQRYQRARTRSSVTTSLGDGAATFAAINSVDIENDDPNIFYEEEESFSSFLSPHHPAKLKRVQKTPLLIQQTGANILETPPEKKEDNPEKELCQMVSRTDSQFGDERPLSPAFSSHSSSSFSSLAKTGEVAHSWVQRSLQECISKWDDCQSSGNVRSTSSSPTCHKGKDSNVDPDLGGDFASPASASSRKRGVCYSPLLDADDVCDLVPTGGLSASLHSSSSYRTRARSRIFSPDSTRKKVTAALSSEKEDRFADRSSNLHQSADKYRSAHDKTDGRCDNETSDTESEKSHLDLDCSFTTDVNDEADDVSTATETEDAVDAVMLPPKTLRSRSSNFDEAIFGSQNETHPTKSESICLTSSGMEKELFESIPCYDDLKFLIKELRKVHTTKNFASFGLSSNCTVVPRSAWPSGRKTAFVQWATTKLGFSLRSAGGNVAYLQVTFEKGADILKALESCLIDHKATLLQKEKETVAAPHNTPLFHTMTLPSSISKPPARRETWFSPMEREIDVGLIDTLGGLKISSSLDDQKAHAASPDSFVGNQSKDTPLVRMVTLDDGRAVPPRSNTACFNDCDLSMSPKDLSFEIRRVPGRLNGCTSVLGHELVHHIHGISPAQSEDSFHPLRHLNASRPRLQRCGSNQSRLSAASQLSPFGQHFLSIDTTHQIESDATEIVETPMPKRSSGLWGSRPMPGKDWGKSAKCDDFVITRLLKSLEAAYSSSEYCTESPFQEHFANGFHSQTSPFVSSSCFVHPSIAETAANSAVLGFDFEADHCPRLGSCVESDLLGEKLDLDAEKDSCLVYDCTSHRRHTLSPVPHRSEADGASVFEGVDFNRQSPEKSQQRRKISLAKFQRISLCANALESSGIPRFSLVSNSIFASKNSCDGEPESFSRDLVDMTDAMSDCRSLPTSPIAKARKKVSHIRREEQCAVLEALTKTENLSQIFSYLGEKELLCTASLVCSKWANTATDAHASLMLISVGCPTSFISGVADETCGNDGPLIDESENYFASSMESSIAKSMERTWSFLNDKFPWAAFLSEGAFKRVYRVWNSSVGAEEAVSVMDVDLIESTGNKNVVGAELAVSVMLSSLVRRNICPNFVLTRGVFTCAFEPPASHWGCEKTKRPKGDFYCPNQRGRKPKQPGSNKRGRYQYIRMELCKHGDVEEYIKRQPDQVIAMHEARCILFQMAFALHTAGDRFGMKHYDVKLLNFFLQSANDTDICEVDNPHTVLRYGVGSHVFSLRVPTERALIAKLADYGTANLSAETNGQPVTLAQFTTIENTPPDYLILGDAAQQGFGHDCFGLGLCMLHLFTGLAPYEEILESVTCPTNLKKKLKRIWEDESSKGYDVIRSLILSDVYEDENGNTEGEPDETVYDTLYRFLVLIGIPKDQFESNKQGKVWRAITSSLRSLDVRSTRNNPHRSLSRKAAAEHVGVDAAQYERDRKIFSLEFGTDPCITRARESLQSMDGGMELLYSLLSFDPQKRASPLAVINSSFMTSLREDPNQSIANESDIVHSFMAYSTR